MRLAPLPEDGSSSGLNVADRCHVVDTPTRRKVDMQTPDRGGTMQPIDVRKLEARRRFRSLRANYFGPPIGTSATERGRGAGGDHAAHRSGRREPDPRTDS